MDVAAHRHRTADFLDVGLFGQDLFSLTAKETVVKSREINNVSNEIKKNTHTHKKRVHPSDPSSIAAV